MICSGVWRLLLLVMVTPVFLPGALGASATLITRGPKLGGHAKATGVVDAFLLPEPLVHDFLDACVGSAEAGEDGQVSAGYRLDDDDLLSAEYFEQVARYVTAAHVGYRVSLRLGVSGLWRNGRVP